MATNNLMTSDSGKKYAKYDNKSGTDAVTAYKDLHPEATKKSIEQINKANEPKDCPNASDAGK